MPATPAKYRVIVVDDSAVMRKLLSAGLNQSGRFEVVGTAKDAYEAWDQIKSLSPDAITLDIQMPRMDGLVFLERLMHQHPLPVIMVSSLTQEGCEATLRALELGAADFVAKTGPSDGTTGLLQELVAKLQRAVVAREDPRTTLKKINTEVLSHRAPFVAIGGNSGGIEALRRILNSVGPNCPPIVVSHFLPAPMMEVMLARMQRKQLVKFRMAEHGEALQPGTVLWAPPNKHMGLRRTIEGHAVELTGAEPLNGSRPSVDYLFRSCLMLDDLRFVAILLDGIGVDGQSGLKEVSARGALAILQRERPSTYEAIRQGVAGSNSQGGIQRMSINEIGQALSHLASD